MSAHNSILAELCEDNEHTDVTIKCRDGEVKMHKNIVCRFSPVLAAAVKDNWVEGKTSTITHEEYDFDTVTCMKQYIYTGTYTPVHHAEPADQNEPSDGQIERIITHIKVFSIGHFYQNQALQDLASQGINKEFILPVVAAGFARVIKMVGRVVPKDHEITNKLQAHILEHSERLLKDDGVRHLMVEDPARQTFLAECFLMAGKRTAEMAAYAEKMKATTLEERARGNKMEKQYNRERNYRAQDVNKLIKALNTHGPSCGNCGATAWSYSWTENGAKHIACKCKFVLP